MQNKKNADLFIIDNLDLIEKQGDETAIQREEGISREIHYFTNEEQKPVILIHHYRKKATHNEKRGIDSIRGSSKITHDPDYILQVKRSDVMDTDADRAELVVTQSKDRDFGETKSKTV
jgi:hypothetical protein